MLIISLAFLAGVLALQAFIAYWRVRWFAKAGEWALADIRKDTYGRLIRLPMAFFAESRVGELSSRIAADLSLIRDTLILTTPQAVRQSVMLVGAMMTRWKSPWLAPSAWFRSSRTFSKTTGCVYSKSPSATARQHRCTRWPIGSPCI